MARSFNGSSDLIDLGNSSALNLSAPITVSAWIFTGTLGGIQQVYTKINPGGTAFYGLLVDNNFKTTAQNNGSNLVGATTLSNGFWYHIVGVFNGGSSSVYLNGVSDASGTTSVSAPGTVDAQIGNDPVNTGRKWNGDIADVAVWSTNLTSGNVTSLFNGVRPVNVNSANLVGWWPLDGYASPESDLSGNGNTGTLTGTARVLGPPQLWRVSQGA